MTDCITYPLLNRPVGRLTCARMAGGHRVNGGLRCQTARRSDVAKSTCSIITNGEVCGRPEFCRRMCQMHYGRVRAHGDPHIKLKPGLPSGHKGTLRERFDRKVIRNFNEWGCWKWIGAHHELGYGRINDTTPDGERLQLRAHVIAWEWENGPVPSGKELDHFRFPDRCIGPACCNPAHLKAVSHRENSLRAISAGPAVNARKTHCPEGHPYDMERYSKGHRRRECSICTKAYRVAYNARRRAEGIQA